MKSDDGGGMTSVEQSCMGWLRVSIAHKGWTKKNNEVYQSLDCLVKELALGTATKVGQQMYGYIQSRALTLLCGQFLIMYKIMLDCKMRG